MQVARQAQDGHDLGGHGDVEARLARHAVGLAAQADHHLAQGAVVQVDHARPGDRDRVDVQRVAVVQVVVDRRGQQVVRQRHGVHVAGEVEVEALHRQHLAVAAARRAALDPEQRAHRRLADRADGALADVVQGHRQADRRERLAFAERRRRDAGDVDVLAVGPVAAVAPGWPARRSWRCTGRRCRTRRRARPAAGPRRRSGCSGIERAISRSDSGDVPITTPPHAYTLASRMSAATAQLLDGAALAATIKRRAGDPDRAPENSKVSRPGWARSSSATTPPRPPTSGSNTAIRAEIGIASFSRAPARHGHPVGRAGGHRAPSTPTQTSTPSWSSCRCRAGSTRKSVLLAVDHTKDVDGLHPMNLGLTGAGQAGRAAVHARPASRQLLVAYGVPIAGQHVVIVGRGITVGRPLAMLLSLKGRARQCRGHRRSYWRRRHGCAIRARRTSWLPLLAAPGLITAEMVKPGAAVVGAGRHQGWQALAVGRRRAAWPKSPAGSRRASAASAR